MPCGFLVAKHAPGQRRCLCFLGLANQMTWPMSLRSSPPTRLAGPLDRCSTQPAAPASNRDRKGGCIFRPFAQRIGSASPGWNGDFLVLVAGSVKAASRQCALFYAEIILNSVGYSPATIGLSRSWRPLG